MGALEELRAPRAAPSLSQTSFKGLSTKITREAVGDWPASKSLPRRLCRRARSLTLARAATKELTSPAGKKDLPAAVPSSFEQVYESARVSFQKWRASPNPWPISYVVKRRRGSAGRAREREEEEKI